MWLHRPVRASGLRLIARIIQYPPGTLTATLSPSVYWYALRSTLLKNPTTRGYSEGGSQCNPASSGFLPRGHTQIRRGTTNHQSAADCYAPCAYTANRWMHPPNPSREQTLNGPAHLASHEGSFSVPASEFLHHFQILHFPFGQQTALA